MQAIAGYELRNKLYSGTHIEIYRGVRARDQQQVIVKKPTAEYPSPRQLASLQHEYQLLKQLQLNGLIKAHELIQHGTTSWLVLEDIEGISLQEFLAGKAIDLPHFFTIAMQLVDVLSALHQHHIIHKDIKPANIIIEPITLAIKLTDLSISSQLAEEIQEYVNPNQLEGTLAYLSPEQTGRMNRSVDYRTDFYSLGITFFEMLTGCLPFTSSDVLELVHCHLAKNPPLINQLNPQMPAMIAAVVAKLLAKMPEERYASTVGLMADLRQCQEQWQTTGDIETFTLGQYDVYTQLHISHKLYGREEQLADLLSAFARVSQGAAELILVSGYSGVGKSSLVREMHKPIIAEKAYFLQGKFDQLQRSTPYSAIIEAFTSLVKQVLAEPDELLQQIIHDLQAALGNVGQVVIDVIPDVEKVIGKQAAIPELTPEQAQNRFILTFQKFLQVFAKKDHPLVLFVDDLQWADNASLKLLEILLSDIDTHHLLIIGAYRDNEVDAIHPLRMTEQALEKAGVKMQSLLLQPLNQACLQQLLADSFYCPMTQVNSLTKLVHEKTQANPFFVNEFLKNLHQQHLLFFNYEQGKWQWQEQAIRQQMATANVTDLLSVKLHQLPSVTQEILKLAACIGHRFDLQTLAIISEQTLWQTAQHLWSALQINLVRPLTENYKFILTEQEEQVTPLLLQETISYQFVHDQVQQAAYHLIPEEKQQQVHLAIGRLFVKQETLSENTEALFMVLDHFNQSLNLLDNDSEKLTIAQANLWAGKRAKSSTAYQSAVQYLLAASSLLDKEKWQTTYELMFEIYKELAECTYLIGDYGRAEHLFQELLQRAKTNILQAEIYYHYLIMLLAQNKLEEGLKIGLTALRLVGVNLPNKPKTYHVAKALLKVRWLMGWRKLKDVQLPAMTDQAAQIAMKLLSQINEPAYTRDQLLSVLIIFKEIELGLTKGYTDVLPYSYLGYAFALLHVFHRHHDAFAIVEASQRLRERFPASTMKAMEELALGIFINHWRYPANVSMDNCMRGYQAGLETGDIIHAHYCQGVYAGAAAFIGRPLAEIVQHTKNHLLFVEKTNIENAKGMILGLEISTEILQGNLPPDYEQFADKMQALDQIASKTEASATCGFYLRQWFILNEIDLAIQAGQNNEIYAECALGTLFYSSNHIYYSLALMRKYPTVSRKEQKHYLKHIKLARRLLKLWMGWCSENFAHFYWLLEAEYAHIKGERLLASDLYDKAIHLAEKHNFIQVLAVASECAARFYFEYDKIQIGKTYLVNAYYAYQKWGAIAKCKLLVEKYPEYLVFNEVQSATINPRITAAATTVTSHLSLDMMAVLKATQALSSEIQLDKLLQRLLKIVLEEAGAQRGVLLLNQQEQWVVEAEGTVDCQNIYLTQKQIIDSRDDLPLTLIHYVKRTQDKVVLQDTMHDEQVILQDNYVQRVKPKSLLILPIISQGHLRRILMVENKTLENAFTAEHLQSLQLLSAQAAISLENAYLYYQATHDPLTGLANRNLLYQTFQNAIMETTADQKQVAVLFCDLDHFKTINDTLGHDIGDKLLEHMANNLKACMRGGDLAVRLGGDEFVLLLTQIEYETEIKAIVEKFYQQIAAPVLIQGHELHLSSSMGISIYPKDGNDIQSLIKKADTALYQAKNNGRNNYQFYLSVFNQQLFAAHEFKKALQQALEQQEFSLYYQPIYDLSSGKLSSLEVLLRWQHPEQGLLTAAQFIAQTEATPFMPVVEEWVLRTACQQAKVWVDKELLNVPLAINISAPQITQRSISHLMQKILTEVQLDPRYIELEFTESVLIENNQRVQTEIEALKAMGLKMIIDDFGTGYSSLSYLKRFPVSKLKIDKSFVQDVEHDEYDRTIIEAIIAMAHRLKLKVVAEGVEDATQLQFLQQQNVDAVQGYYFSVPLDREKCEGMLNKQKVS